MLEKKNAAAATQMKTGGTSLCVFHAKRPMAFMFGMKLRCFVFSIARLNMSSSPGMSRNTVSIEISMDFISTLPRSPPRPNCMNVIATRPPMVVSEDEAISGIAFDSASTAASYGSKYRRSSAKRLHRMMA